MKVVFISALICLIVAIGWALLREYWIYIPGIIAKLRDPVHTNRVVEWNSPETLSPEDNKDTSPPNVILIVVDDLGFNDISFFGGGVHDGNITTPSIDSIAKNGIYFSNAYAGHATCAPARAALMTGRYPSRVGYEFTPTHPLYAKILGTSAKALRKGIYHKDLADSLSTENMTLPKHEVTLAEYMKKLDYRTIMLGKWHLGDTEGSRAIDRGFDETLGFSMVSKYLPDTDPRVVNFRLDDLLDKMLFANVRHFVEKDGGDKFAPAEFLTDYLARQAARAIHANKDRPFFLYMAFNAPHTPLQALRADYDQLAHIPDELTRVYGAIMMSLDRAVGTILDAIEKEGLRDNTMVIFTNDNGAPNWVMRKGANSPFRGWKGTLFEGGIRVPMFMQWPKHIQAGSVMEDIVGHVDILPTVLAAATSAGGGLTPVNGIDSEKELERATERRVSLFDGVNLLPFVAHAKRDLSNAEQMDGDGAAPHESLFWRSGHYKALRRGDWKLQVAERPKVQWLFDLKRDPYEMSNLANIPEHAEIMDQMLTELRTIDVEQSTPLWESITETAVFIDKFFEHDEKLDDEYVYWPN